MSKSMTRELVTDGRNRFQKIGTFYHHSVISRIYGMTTNLLSGGAFEPERTEMLTRMEILILCSALIATCIVAAFT
jgi:hypothetical protein